MATLTLKPGYLVSLSVRSSGGVRYERQDLDKTEDEEGKTRVTKWETTKIVADPAEHEAAGKLRSKCRNMISRVCARSAFGLLCPTDKVNALDDAIAEARGMVTAFNGKAKASQLSVYVLKGKIAETDQEAAEAIADELKGLLGEMRNGILMQDVDAIRDAATTALQMGKMLDEQTTRKIGAAVEEARNIASEIRRRLAEEADTVAGYVQEVKLINLSESRFAFLDTDAVGEAPKVEAAVREVEVDEDGQANLPGMVADNDDGVKAAAPSEPSRSLEV
jgi:hypothetical protein